MSPKFHLPIIPQDLSIRSGSDACVTQVGNRLLARRTSPLLFQYRLRGIHESKFARARFDLSPVPFCEFFFARFLPTK